MKNPSIFRPTHAALWLALLLAMPASVQAAPPDLTAPGVIATIDRSETYNLGPTGLRGWIYISRGSGNTHGQDGTMTAESRQILVTVASSPGSAELAVDDVILGAMAANTGAVPLFSSDARKTFGTAIGDAEKTGAGTLRVKRWRANTITDVNIPMTIMGDYTATAPYSCPKSTLILANARNRLVARMISDPYFPDKGWSGAVDALALLGGVQSGDPNYAEVQTRLQTYARDIAAAGPVNNGLPIWDWGYMGIFLAEYYLSTGDATVLPGISQYSVKLAQSQSMLGTFGHSPSALRADGSGRRSCIGYGPINSAGTPANLAIVLGKKALLAGGQDINPEIDPAIQRGSDFLKYYVNKGSIPYGEHAPGTDSHSSNGKDSASAVFFGMQAGRPVETEYFTRMTIADFTGREYGHTGQGFSYLWGAMGANIGGSVAAAEYLKNIRWHLDLSRRTDGSFTYDGGEQYGGGSTSDGSYLGDSSYYGLSPTASYILTYGLPLQRLHITGKNAAPANTLDSTKVAAAVAAATFKQDCVSYSNTQLITYLSDYDPVVRHHAATVLASRPPTSNEITNTLIPMVTGSNANGRMGAIQTLGILQNATALPLIAGRLSDPDLWVRAKAAGAIRSYSSASASAHLTTMLNAYIANATDPNAIVWSDPVQIANGALSLALFGNAVPDGSPGNNVAAYTIGASKDKLYPAVKAGLKQPDSYPRTGAADFCFDRLLLADVQALMPDFFEVIQYECQADRMWSASPRASGISTMSKYKIKEGIRLAVEMLEVQENFGWGSEEFLIAALNALATYGDSARWTLPKLRGFLGKWDPTSAQYTKLVSTINTIEAAITAPALVPGKAVANSQVVASTGTQVITLTGTSPRTTVTFTNVTAPAHGTLTGTAPSLTYTPNVGYTGPDHFTFQAVDDLTTSDPGTVSIIVGTAGTGLKGEYFDNINFTNLKLTRTDAQVNFDWGTGSPNALLGADTFSVRWDGLLLVPETGTYTFSTLNSDGVKLYVNGVLVIDDYTDQTTNWKDGASVNLTAGQMVDLHMRYYENTGSAVAKLKWTGPSFAGDNGVIIGTQWLFDGTGMTRTPYAHAQSVTLVQNSPLPVTLTGSGGTLTYAIITPPTHGTLTGTAPNLTYTPAANYNGTDSFTFLVNNGTSNSNPATVSIGIQAGPPVDFFWAAATSGNWSGASSWTNAALATVVPDPAGQAFYRMSISKAGTYTSTQDLNAGFLLNQLNFAGAVTLAGTNNLAFAANGTLPPSLNQNSSSVVSVGIPLSLNATTGFGGTGGGRVEVTGRISGAGGLSKDGAGELWLYSTTANNYSGPTIINNGTLHLGAIIDGISPLFSNPTGSGAVTLNNGTIKFERVAASNPLTVNGGTLHSDNGWGASWSGPITLNATATVSAPWGFTCSGTISGAGGFAKTGDNTLTLSGTNSFTGSNKITAGTLTCTKAAALGTGALDITNGAKVNLNFTGTRTISALTYNAEAPLPPGTYGSNASPAANKNDTYFSGTGTITILPATTTALALTSGSAPAAPGAPLTFTATVTGSSPTGNVAFYDGTTLLGTSALNGSFQASHTTSSLAIGPRAITARYAGNATNATSTSPAVAVEIISLLPPAPANLLGTSGSGQVNLTWSLSTGATSYYVKRSLNSGGPYTVIGNPGTGVYDDLTAVNGTTYYYVVSAINTAGESGNSNQIIGAPGPQPSTTTLVISPVATGAYGDDVTFTATVTVSGGPATGTVTFRDGVTVLGTGTLNAGAATFAISTLAVANHPITATYEGDATFNTSVSAPSAYLVAPKALTITGVTASDKIYDGNATAALTGGTVSSGVVGGETVSIVPGTGAFASPNAGAWAVTATGYSLSGANSGNYALSAQPTVLNATISPLPLLLSGTRIYDGTNLATSTGLTISNKILGDDLTLTGTAILVGKDAGSQALVYSSSTPTRVRSSSGFSAGSTSTSFTVTMSAAPATGNTLVAVISTRGNAANRVTGITSTGATWARVTQSVNSSGSTTEIWSAPVGSGAATAVTITTVVGRCAGVVIEYSGIFTGSAVDQTATSPGATDTLPVTGTTPSTTQANELWIGGIGHRNSSPTLGSILNSFTSVASAQSGSTTAGNNAKVHALERIVNTTGTASSGGTLNSSAIWSGAIATFKSTTNSNLALSGAAAGNYTLTGLTGAVDITPKALALSTTPTVTGKIYDGLTAATLTGATLRASQASGTGTTSDGNPYTGDAVTAVLSGVFDTKDVGSGKAVTSTSILVGAQKGNYTLTQPIGLTGAITPKTLTLTATPAVIGKSYDGFTAATLTDAELRVAEAAGTGTSSDGTPYTGDAVSLNLIGNFDTKDVGVGKAVVSTSALVGAQKDNYSLNQPEGMTGTITPAGLSITADDRIKTYGQTLAFGNGASQFTSNGLQNGETIGSVTLTCAGGDAAAAVASYPISPDAATGGTFDAGNYDINYVSGTLAVNPAGQTITFGLLADRIYGDAPFSLTATADSGLAVSYVSSDPTVADVLGNTVTIFKTGSTIITASQAGDGNHHAALPVAQTLTVNPAPPVTFEAWAADPAQGLTAGVNDGPLDDPDHDGFINLLEFTLCGNPMVSSQAIRPILTHIGGTMAFSYDRSHPSKPSTTQVVEYGSDLNGWTPLTIPADSAGAVTITPGPSSDHVEVALPPQGDNGFVRLKVSQ